MGAFKRPSRIEGRQPAEKGPAQSPKLRHDYAMLYEVLGELWGNRTPARSIGREHCRAVREVFSALPANARKRKGLRAKTLVEAAAYARAHNIPAMTPKTANQHLARLSNMLGWAVREEFLERNPAVGLQVAAPEAAPKDARRPFAVDQLKAIFSAPLYTGCIDDWFGHDRPGPHVIRRRFFIPLLALFSGARLNELCQLCVSDIDVRDGVPVLLIRPDAESGMRLKTKSSRRIVPVHGELHRVGLLRYVEQTRAAGEIRLWPELRQDKRGYYSDHFQKWFSRFLVKAGAAAPRTSFQSFRHCFRDALREANVSCDVALALGGWRAQSVDEQYGAGLRLILDSLVLKIISFQTVSLWAVGSGQWAVGSGQWAVGSGQWAGGQWAGGQRIVLQADARAGQILICAIMAPKSAHRA